MKTDIVNMTPTMAERFLTANTHNRKLDERRVDQLTKMIARGEWQFNGSAIVFDTNGVLVDGQHRLAAIAQAGIACQSLVVCGVEASSQLTIDSGKSRNTADQLTLLGCPSATSVAGLLLRIFFWDTVLENGEKDLKHQGWNRASTKQLLDLFHQIGQEPLVEAVNAANRVTTMLPIHRGELSHCYMLFNRIDEEDTQDFMFLLATGTGLSENHPVFQLRQRVQKEATMKKFHSFKAAGLQRALIIKAWNFYRDGVEIKMLTFKPGGAKPEAYPMPR